MINKNLKVSIIVPVYNVEQYLKKCLDTLLNQTLKEIEIICINDCSPDNSINILQDYQTKYGSNLIKIINHTENKGVAISRNNGLEISIGEYIGFVDPDDWVDLNFFEILYKKGIETEADIVKGNLKKVKNSKTTISRQNKKIKKSLVNFCSNAWITSIYKTSIIRNNNILFPNITHGEDDVFLTNAKLHSKKIIIIDNVFYYYFQREVSSSKERNINSLKSTIECRNLQIDLLNSSNISKKEYLEYYNRFLKEMYWYKLELIKSLIKNNITNSKYKITYINKLKLFFKNFFTKVKFMRYIWRSI